MMFNEDQPTNVADAVTAGMHIGETREFDEGFVGVVLPQGAKLEKIDLMEQRLKYADTPMRKTGVRSFATAVSFIAYVNAHAIAGTTIYANKNGVRFQAVFNDHEPEPKNPVFETQEIPRPEGVEGGPEKITAKITIFEAADAGWCDFTATYGCPLSVEWQRWVKHSQHANELDQKRGMKHADFIQFMEDNLQDIVKPDAGFLMTALGAFDAKKDVQFKSAMRLQDGSVAFNYSEQVNQVAQDGRLLLPEQFTISVPVFDGGNRYEVDAKLRYRVSAGGLMLWYELVRPHKVLEHAFNTVREQVATGVGEVPVYDV